MQEGLARQAIVCYQRSLAAVPTLVRNHLSIAAAHLEMGDEAGGAGTEGPRAAAVSGRGRTGASAQLPRQGGERTGASAQLPRQSGANRRKRAAAAQAEIG